MPVFGGVEGPWKRAMQCMCSGVYFKWRNRKLASLVA